MSTLRSATNQPQTSSSTAKLPADRIAKRAYEKWVGRGCKHGNDLQDWVEAERELMIEQNRQAAPAAGMRR